MFERAGGLKIGWGLLVAWLFCTYYTGIVPMGGIAASSAAPIALQMLDATLALLFAIVAICLLVIAERRSLPFLHAPALSLVAGAFVAVGTALGPFAQNLGVALLGDMLTGFGSSVLWMLWGEEYTQDSSEDVEAATLSSAILAAILTGIVYASASVAALALVLATALPLASGLLLHSARKEREGNDDKSPESAVGATAPSGDAPLSRFWTAFVRSGIALFLMFAFLSLLQGLCPDLQPGSPAFPLGLLASIIFVLVVGRVSFNGPRRVSVSFLFRWAVPLVVTGFALIVLFDAPLGYELAFDLAVMGRLAFWVIAQLYFSRFVERGMAPAMMAYGTGWLFLHLGDLVGTWVSIPLSGTVAAGGIGANQVMAVCIICVVLCSLIPFGRDRSFDSAPEKSEAEEPETAEPSSTAVEDAAPQPDDYERKLARIAADHKLTPRETEIFGLLMHGRSIPFIRDELVISRDTVATHVKHIYAKTGVHSRQELLDLAQ